MYSWYFQRVSSRPASLASWNAALRALNAACHASACAARPARAASASSHVRSSTAQQASGLSTYPRDTEHVEKAFDFGGMPAPLAALATGLYCAYLALFRANAVLVQTLEDAAAGMGISRLVLLTPYTPETHGIVNAKIFDAMKPTKKVPAMRPAGCVPVSPSSASAPGVSPVR